MQKFIINKEDTILMIIDIQEKLVPAMDKAKKVIKNTNILATAANELNIPILTTEQYPKGLGHTIPELIPNIDSKLIFEKVSFSAYIAEVKATLENLNKKKILISGMETHICVFQTVRDLVMAGYDVFLVSDAVCSRSKENYKNGLQLASDMGAVITNTETVLFDLLKEAATPEFKLLSKLIK